MGQVSLLQDASDISAEMDAKQVWSCWERKRDMLTLMFAYALHREILFRHVDS